MQKLLGTMPSESVDAMPADRFDGCHYVIDDIHFGTAIGIDSQQGAKDWRLPAHRPAIRVQASAAVSPDTAFREISFHTVIRRRNPIFMVCSAGISAGCVILSAPGIVNVVQW